MDNDRLGRTALTVLIGVFAVVPTSCGHSDTAIRDTTGSSLAPSGIPSSELVTESPPTTTPFDDAPTQPCTSAELRVTLGDQAERRPGSQIVLALRFTNGSNRPCTTEGYPGATLEGPDDPNLGPHFVLMRSTTITPKPLTLAPGRTATADLTAMVASIGNGWLPDRLLTTAPDDTVAVTLPWPTDLPVPRQDSATRPATYIGPLTE